MPEGHDATIEVCNIMSFVLYTQILKQSVLKPASPGITLNYRFIVFPTELTQNLSYSPMSYKTCPCPKNGINKICLRVVKYGLCIAIVM